MLTRKSLTAALVVLAIVAACDGKSDGAPDMDNVGKTSAPQATDISAAMPRSPSPEGARVFFVEPADGAIVTSPVHFEFGVEGMQVVPAGTEAMNSGHHHIIVDTGLPPMDLPIPADLHHIHFGDGRKATDLDLARGQHTLQLVFADHLHIPHDPAVYSERITVTVE